MPQGQAPSGASDMAVCHQFVITRWSVEFGAPVLTIDELTQRRLQRLVEVLMVELKARQSVTYGADYVGDVETWRTAARIAGHRLGISIRTGVSKDGTKVWASEGP